MNFGRTLLSDSDRGLALDALTEHFVDGRLALSDFDQRSSAVLDARCVDDLGEAFDGVPGGVPFTPDAHGRPVLRTSGTTVDTHDDRAARADLEDLVRKGKVMDKIDGVVWTLGLGTFAVLQFIADVDHAWLAIVAGLVLSLVARAVVGFDDDDEEHYEQIKQQESEERAERRRLAMERRAELKG